jgi:hypothetical protein
MERPAPVSIGGGVVCTCGEVLQQQSVEVTYFGGMIASRWHDDS